MARAIFRCQVCMSVAATVELAAAPNALTGQLILEGFLWNRSDEMLKGRTIQMVYHALTAHDARLLYTIDQLWAPFYCPQCDRVYCIKHWHVTPQFDHDLPGWYDSSYGICPKGHRRLLDD